MSTITI